MTTGPLSHLIRRRRRRSQRGQSLAEFSIVFPFFIAILFGLIEFSFALNAVLTADFATRDAALTGAESGAETGSDCSILRVIEQSVRAPADAKRIEQVKIFKAKPTGLVDVGVGFGAPINLFTRTTNVSLQYACPDGTGKVPYKRDSNGYPESVRCSILAGCGTGSTPTTVDNIGVEITYRYDWKTPLPNFIPQAPFLTIVKANAMRLEPIL